VSRSLAFIATLVVGGLIGLQAPANAALARHVGDVGAAFISGTITATTLALALLIFGHPSQLSGLSGFRPQHAIGGLGGAAVVLVSLIAVRTVGVAAVAALLIFGQLVIAVVADRLGLFGVTVVGLTPGRWAGIVLVAAGTLLITRP